MKNPLVPRSFRPGAAVISMLAFGWFAVPAHAEILYIKPSLEVLMRKNPGDNAQIVATVPMGTAVELVQGGKEWARVKLQGGTEGWVRSRFLGSSPLLPVTDIKPGLGPNGTVIDSQGRFRNLAGENERLRKELGACTTDRSTLADKYQALIADPASDARAKNDLGEARQQIETLRQQLTESQIECTVLKKNRSIIWFFTGAAVLLLGWLIGRLSATYRKKKPSLMP
ncbi:MAG: TIGR04211 family SH3 domain-containing protein [Proteobacteria bacterium]|nr:TIGR04211 family SH3 domain-containing protein [Pseudomonadota bacterium]